MISKHIGFFELFINKLFLSTVSKQLICVNIKSVPQGISQGCGSHGCGSSHSTKAGVIFVNSGSVESNRHERYTRTNYYYYYYLNEN